MSPAIAAAAVIRTSTTTKTAHDSVSTSGQAREDHGPLEVGRVEFVFRAQGMLLPWSKNREEARDAGHTPAPAFSSSINWLASASDRSSGRSTP